jgi:hypothetical protein
MFVLNRRRQRMPRRNDAADDALRLDAVGMTEDDEENLVERLDDELAQLE